MRPLDRLFGSLYYPLDVLLPSACWLALSAAVLGADAGLWYAVGVDGAVQPDQLFRGYSSWTGPPTVLMAALLNEVAAVALLAAGAKASACRVLSRSPRR